MEQCGKVRMVTKEREGRMNEAFESALAAGDLAAMRKAIQAAHDARFAEKVHELNQLRDSLVDMEREHTVFVAASRDARVASLQAAEAVRHAEREAAVAARAAGIAANEEGASRSELAATSARIAELEHELRAAVEVVQAPIVHSLLRRG